MREAREFSSLSVPDTLQEYALTRPQQLSPRTRTHFRNRWNKFIVVKAEEIFFQKVRTLITWVIDQYASGQHTPATFRQYRSVCYFGLSTIFDEHGKLRSEFREDCITVKSYEYEYNRLRNFKLTKAENLRKTLPADQSNNKKIKYELRTSAKKLKGFPQPIYEWLIAIDSVNKPAVALLQKFLKANLLLGLRPIEWLNLCRASNIETRQIVLVVNNAKDSFGRANGATRTLILTGVSEGEERAIGEFKSAFNAYLELNFNKFKKDCEDYYLKNPRDRTGEMAQGQHQLDQQHGMGASWNPCIRDVPMEELVQVVGEYENEAYIYQPEFAHRQLNKMQNTLARLLNDCPYLDSKDPKRPMLYSTRHQAIANAKKSKMPVIEMAAFFGHASIKTAREHYGKAGAGWRKFTYTPDPDSVALVRQPSLKTELSEPTSVLKSDDNYNPSMW